MENFKIEPVYPLFNGKAIQLPAEQFGELVEQINKVIDAVNTLNKFVVELSERVYDCETNISKIAQILEEMYDAS